MSYQYASPPIYEYAPSPPSEPTYVVPPPPPSAFSPLAPDHTSNYGPGSPLVFAASPAPSIAPSRNSSRHRQEYIAVGGATDRGYLAPGGYGGGLGRSNSERGRVGGQIVVENRRAGHSRTRSEYDQPRSKKYYEDDAYSNYSVSSYGGGDSRDHSRPHSRLRVTRHSRTPSCGSVDSYDDDRYAVAPYRPSKAEEELTAKLQEVQKQLEKVQVDAEKKRLQEKEAKLEAERTAEIERKVLEKIENQKRQEEEKRAAEQRKMEEEKRRIEEAARKLLEEQAAQAAAAKAAEERKKQEIAEIVAVERKKYEEAKQGKKTYTRFSKTHLCKEALEEKSIEFTEEKDYFLVHRFVEKTEQQYLWNRTKEIRNYYRQIQEAADRAPTVPGPNGGYVKYVQIAGQPYPMALPVTITHTPGGGQTQRVESAKIKWSDIFRG